MGTRFFTLVAQNRIYYTLKAINFLITTSNRASSLNFVHVLRLFSRVSGAWPFFIVITWCDLFKDKNLWKFMENWQIFHERSTWNGQSWILFAIWKSLVVKELLLVLWVLLFLLCSMLGKGLRNDLNWLGLVFMKRPKEQKRWIKIFGLFLQEIEQLKIYTSGQESVQGWWVVQEVFY